MRIVTVEPTASGVLERSEAGDQTLLSYLETEKHAANAARQSQVSEWKESYRQLEARPRVEVRNSPIPNAPNIEVPLGAMFSESVFATVLDTIFQASPLLTARGPRQAEAKAFQAFINRIAEKEVNLRPAVEQSFLDCCQLGTGVFYIPFTEETKKGASTRIVRRGPRVFSIPVEDVLVPGASDYDVQTLPWVGIRFWYRPGEFASVARRNKWDVEGCTPSAATDEIRKHRQHLAGTSEHGQNELHAVWLFWAYFDYDGDGLDEDLLVVYHEGSSKLLRVDFNPYDYRPLTVCRYQLRPHLFWGKGIVEMVRPFEEEASDQHNERTLNIRLANARVWFAPNGQLDESFVIYPNRVKQVADPSQIVEKKLSDVYPSAWQSESQVISLAERRCGIVGDLSSASPASRLMGTRTPATTAMSTLQAVNRRFTPPFDSMKNAACDAIKQALFRYQERLLAGDRKAEQHIMELLGPEDGNLVILILKDKQFADEMTVEFTAVSASVNRDADRQNAMMLVQMLGQYYQRIIELTQLASTPGIAPQVAKIAIQVAEKASEVIDRTIRTFDQVRDPKTFLLDIEEELSSINPKDQALQAIAQLMGGLQNPGGVSPVAPGGAEGAGGGIEQLLPLIGQILGGGEGAVEPPDDESAEK